MLDWILKKVQEHRENKKEAEILVKIVVSLYEGFDDVKKIIVVDLGQAVVVVYKNDETEYTYYTKMKINYSIMSKVERILKKYGYNAFYLVGIPAFHMNSCLSINK